MQVGDLKVLYRTKMLPAMLGTALLLTIGGCENKSASTGSGSSGTTVAKAETGGETAPQAAATTDEGTFTPTGADESMTKQDPREDAATPAALGNTPAPRPSNADRATKAGTNPASSLGASTGGQPAASRQTPAPAVIGVVATPNKLELGEIPTNDAKTGTITLTNNGDTPHTVLDCKTSCGCTTANCKKGTVLQPGESMEVDIKLSGGTRPVKLSKTVTFLISDQAPLLLQVSGQAIAYVTVTPDRLTSEQNPDGRVVMRAIDDQPFTIKSMYPPLIEAEEFSDEPKVEHEVVLDWENLRESGHRSTKLIFTLDHPLCKKAMVTLSPLDIATKQEITGRTAPPVGTTPTFDLDRMLKEEKTADVLRLIDEGDIEIGHADRSGQTPLVKAARWGNPAVLQRLLDEGADLTFGDRVGRTPLMYACQSKSLECVQMLLDAGSDIAARDQIGNTALCWGAGFGTPAIVQELLDAGAQVEVSGALTGFTPLIWAAGFGSADSITMLIEAGANIEAKDVLQGSTPLMNAVRTGGPENVRALLDAGADLEARDNEGKTSLLVAASNAGPDAAQIQMLVDAGADLYALTGANESVLDLANRRTDLRSQEVIELLTKLVDADKLKAAKEAADS